MKRFILFLLFATTILPLWAQTRYWGDLYNCNDYNSFSLRLINFNEGGEKHFIANDSKMEISLVHNGEKVTVPSKGESKPFNGKATSIFDNCSVYLDGFPVENYNQYIRFYNDMKGKLDQLVNSEDFVSKMYGMPDTRNPENLANGIKIAQKLISQLEDLNKGIQNKLNARDVSRNFDDFNYLDKLSNSYTINTGVCKKVIGSNQASIEIAKKESEAKKREEVVSKGEESKSAVDDDFWSSTGKANSQSNNTVAAENSLIAESNFQNNLSHIKEGEFFKDSDGQYYQKTARGAKVVDKSTYERVQANKITADFQRREAERQHMEAVTTHAINTTFTSFYAMNAAGQNLKNATVLEGHFENVEDLNRAFAQKLREVSRMGDELRATSMQSTQNYARAVTAANATTATDYAYGEVLSTVGGIAAGISADKAAKKAREELREQRAAHERDIKARQLIALMDIRGEIDNMFPEGGMPLSSHKITAPVLYLFAYSSNKTAWKQDKTVPVTLSNVIPVYRYSDGSYPYVSQIKRTFENADVTDPVIIGYFTDQATAEKYQQSFVEMAHHGRFLLNQVTIQVAEKKIDSTASAEIDFWGTSTKTNNNSQKKPITKKKEADYWK